MSTGKHDNVLMNQVENAERSGTVGDSMGGANIRNLQINLNERALIKEWVWKSARRN